MLDYVKVDGLCTLQLEHIIADGDQLVEVAVVGFLAREKESGEQGTEGKVCPEFT